MPERLKILLNFKGLSQSEYSKIPLYMDQLLLFFEDALTPFKRSKVEPILTKTMINNYVKAKLLPAPESKKYNRLQMMQLRLILHLKNVLSIEDIRKLVGAGKNGVWSWEVETGYTWYEEAESAALEQLKKRIEPYEQEKDPEALTRLAMQLAAEANVLKLAAERLIES